MNTAYLGLGSNLGDRRRHLTEAIRQLNAGPDTRVTAVSSVYETAPVGVTAQPDFLNLAVRVDTRHPARELLDQCLHIEAGLGRVRSERWGPRTIDIDLLLYADACIRDARLQVPHPRMQERSFVLIPLAEIAPELRLAGGTVAEWAARLGAAGVRRLGPLEWRAPGAPPP
ncbi:MAG TPA: 2-amino-4-hydroxy-6-hydroxymethyldihydropteridine diphosphokinase [Opitutaceae bacterium]|nr:2-amino-4-hydroxy-6-hydroxymethyldihydropteridine diphosphokinase [Opitutaceae bacterium]